MRTVDATTPFCAAVSRALGEPMVGTASKDGAYFLLVGYDGAWAPDVLEGSDLAPEVKKHLVRTLEEVDRARLLFVRGHRPIERPFVYVVCTLPGERFVLRFDLERYEDLLELSLGAIARDRAHPRATRVESPIVLVCTHGRRDRCCAKEGVAVFQEASRIAPEIVLQTSHTGGHRFAAVVVTLPDGLSYGRVEPSDAPALIDAVRANRIFDLAKLRGRAGIDEPLQAAEVFVRRELDERDVDAVRALGVTKSPAGAHVTVLARGEKRDVTVTREELGVTRPGSCGDEPQPAYALRVVP